jgi:hypothetical protein
VCQRAAFRNEGPRHRVFPDSHNSTPKFYEFGLLFRQV